MSSLFGLNYYQLAELKVFSYFYRRNFFTG